MSEQTTKKVFRFGARVVLASLLTISVFQTGQACGGTPILSELENADYTGLQVGNISLSNGKWEGLPYVEGGAARPRAGLLKDFLLSADLNGNGNQESIVVLWENSGGTGSYSYVAVMTRHNSKIKNIGTTLIGDRVKIRNGKIENGEILLEVLQAGEDDAMCCPTMLATRSWSMENGKLEEGKMEVTGKLSETRREENK